MAATSASHATLVDVLRARAESDPDRVAFIFLSDGQHEKERITYAELHRRAAIVGAHLQSVAAPGDRALLLFPGGLDFLAAFLGTLYAGLIAVPAYPPGSSQTDGKVKRLQSMMEDSRPRCLLTTPQVASRLQSLGSGLGEHCALVQTSTLDDSWAERWHSPAVRPESIAFLQYTSGSTAAPRGVMVSHDNVLQNERLIQMRCSHSADSTVVSWLPHYHDMGLIGSLLQPLYVGSLGVFMSPSAFLHQPICWLRAISQYRAYTSGGPNFAYELCLARTSEDQFAGLDLSSWRIAFNGAERVRPVTLERFSRALEPYGFRREAFFACYGLAEATLIVSGGSNPRVVVPYGEAAANALTTDAAVKLVTCGTPVADTSVAIVDPQTLSVCPPGQIGELWVQGPSVAAGYWNNPELSERVFRASLPDHSGTFLRTGDLGLRLDGEVVVTGRLKDLIIIRGQNYHAEDIESSVADSHPALRSQPGAAFSAEIDGAEELIVVQEVGETLRDDLRRIAELIRESISRQHELRPHTLLLLGSTSIPRTSSGKVQRQLCRRLFAAGSFRPLLRHTIEDAAGGAHDAETATISDADARRLALELVVSREVARVLRIAHADARKPLTVLGIDSVGAADLEYRLMQCLRVPVPAAFILSGITLRDLIERVARLDANTDADRAEDTLPQNASADAPRAMSAEQERLWSLSSIAPANSAFNISAAACIRGPLDIDVLRQAIDQLANRHQMLRACFTAAPAGPQISIQPAVQVPLDSMAVPELPPAKRRDWITQACLEHTAVPFDLAHGPLIRFRLFQSEPGEHLLLAAAHHLISDAHSFGVIFTELASLYQTTARRRDSSLKPFRFEPTDFSRPQSKSRHTSHTASGVAFWKDYLKDPPPPLRTMRSQDKPAPPSGKIGHYRFVVPDALMTRLQELGNTQAATPFVVLLAVWNALLFRLTGRDDLIVATPVGGRDRPELQQLIGCFAYPLVLRFEVSAEQRFTELLARTRESFIKAYEHRQLGFADVVDETRQLRNAGDPVFQVMVGFTKVPAAPDDGSATVFDAPYMVRPTTDLPLFINLVDREGSLEGSIWFQASFVEPAVVEQLATGYVTALQAVVAAPDCRVADLPAEMAAGQPPSASDGLVEIGIAAGYTAEPLSESLSFWTKQLGASWQVHFAAAGPVIQQFIDPHSVFARSTPGINVLLVQPGADYLATPPDQEQLLDSIESFQARSKRPLLACICPSRAGAPAGDSRWADRLARMPAVHVIRAADIVSAYPVEHIYDDFAARIADLPYTRDFYAALGTLLSRKIRSLTDPPFKAIVLDCDHTLWNGVCAEDGPKGISLDASRLFLQEFLAEQKRAGMLLCLCSKNEEGDVIAAFQEHASMPLGFGDFIATRVNWAPKSENLRALSDELHIALDSLIFIDDNPLECAEVEANCPGVLTVCINDPQDIATTLRNVWGFDRLAVTAEDVRKTDLYRQERERESIAREAPTVEQFIEDLALTVDIRPMRREDAARVSQLSFRVTQFNLTSRRYSEAELLHRHLGGSCECLTVAVKDRFGDYGLVGCVIFERLDRRLRVDGFLLSCRALGRRVEYAMLDALRQVASAHRLPEIEIPFAATGRNTPAQQFVKAAGGRFTDDEHGRTVLVLATDDTSTPSSMSGMPLPPHVASPPQPAPATLGSRTIAASLLSRIARELRDVDAIVRAIDADKGPHARVSRDAASSPHTETEMALAAIWTKVIGVDVTDACADFFSLGGDSLLAVRVLSRIWDRFQVDISLDVLFAGPLTVRAIASTIDELRATADRDTSTVAVAADSTLS